MSRYDLEIRTVPIGKLKPAKYNPRKDLKQGDEEYTKLEKSLDRWGLQEPLVWNEATGNLVGGHQRLKICKARGDKEVQAVVVNLDSKKEKLLNMALNKISADWDYDALGELLSEFDTSGLEITGFSIEELNNFVKTEEEKAPDMNAFDRKPPAIGEPDDYEEVFKVYLVFQTKGEAEAWLEKYGYEQRFAGASHMLNIERVLD